jgi:septal ring factor EnvC (AmiA/AmiB activator)
VLPYKYRTQFGYFKQLAILAGMVGLCSNLLNTAYAAPDAQDIETLKQALASSESRSRNYTEQLHELSDEIRSLKGKLVVAAKVATSLDQKLVDVEERLTEIKQVESDTLADLTGRNKELASTLSALINLSRQPEGSLVGNPAGLVDSLRASTLMQSIIPQLKKDADLLSRQLEALAELKAQYHKEQTEFEKLRAERETEQKELDRLLIAKRTAQEKLSGAQKSEQSRLDKLAANIESATALLAQLEKEKQQKLAQEQKRLAEEIARKEKQARLAEEERVAAAATAQEKTVKLVPPTPSKPAQADKPKQQTAKLALAPSARRFFDAKGTLPLPVGGRIVSNYNESNNSGLQKGIVIESRPEAAVISPYDGKIAFAGPFRHYGLLLIIDHGDGFHTLLSGMGSIDGSVGQLLLAGEPIGQMKSSRNEKPKLYMELRRKGAPINPIPWLLAENRKVSG